jgi:tetratricopeptide (TPR) repeat protein
MTRRRSLRILALALLLGLVLTIIVGERVVRVQRQPRVEAVINAARDHMTGGQYDRAVEAFSAALTVAPNSEDVKTWYRKARRYQDFASWYAQAEAAIAGQRWDEALGRLEQIAALDPTYEDVTEKIEFVKDQVAGNP